MGVHEYGLFLSLSPTWKALLKLYIYGSEYEVQTVADHLLFVPAIRGPFSCGACVVTTYALPDAAYFAT